MGEVWRGVHVDLDVPVAVKCLLPNDNEDEWAESSFANEVRAAASLHHPGVVVVLDHGMIDDETAAASNGRLAAGSPFLVMELLHGQSLHAKVGRLGWTDLRDILLQLLAALAHSHARGVIHRDLKPGNVLLEPRTDASGRRLGWRARITDFGLARALEKQNASEGVVAGTPAYMAPEQLQGHWRDQGPWTDLYSLGCLAWSLSSGTPPFGRQRAFAEISLDHLHRPPPALVPRNAVPVAFEAWLLRLLEKDPRRRFASAADAAQALRALEPSPLLEPFEPAVDVTNPGPVFFGEKLHADDDTTGSPIGKQAEPDPIPEISTQVLPEDIVAGEVPTWDPTGRPSLELTRCLAPSDWRSQQPSSPAHRLVGVGMALYGLRSIPLVGREEERTRIWEGLSRVEQTGRAHLLFLRGPSGCGKTRLASWLGQTAHQRAGTTVLSAQHASEGGPRSGLAAMLAQHLRTSDLSGSALRARVERLALRRGLLEMDEVPAVCALLQPAGTDEETDPGTPVVRFETPRERFALLRRILSRLDPTPRPLVLVFDDVQWGAEALQFAQWLLQTQPTHKTPFLVVLTVQEAALAERPEEAVLLERLAQRDDSRVLEIDPLSTEHQAHLVRALLGMDGELAAEVTRRTAGNPLFAVQLVGDWIERGVLEPGRRGFRLKDGAQVEIPESLHAVWRGRVNRLLDAQDSSTVCAIELAAILGDKVNRQEWKAVCARTGTHADLRRVLGRMLVLRLARTDPEGTHWRFSHPMLRESIVRRAQESGRVRTWHQACANMLEMRYPHGATERIAWHLLAAGDDKDALPYLLLSAESRVERGDLDVAERILDERAAAVRRVGPNPDDPIHGAGWFLRLRLLRIMGRVDEANAYVAQAVDAARRHRWTELLAEARIHQGILTHRSGSFVHAWRRLRQGEELARETGRQELVASALLEQGRLLIERGRLPDAAGCLDRARVLFAQHDDRTDQANCDVLLGRVAKQKGDLDKAMAHFSDALDAFEKVGSRWGVANCTNELGEVARLQGDLNGAGLHYRDACAKMEELGADDANVMRVNVGLVCIFRSRFSQAEPLLERSLRNFEATHHKAMVGITHAMLLCCAAARQDWAGWDAHANAAIPILTETGWIEHDIALVARLAGDLAAALGEVDRAREAWEMALLQWKVLDRPEEVEGMQRRLQAED